MSGIAFVTTPIGNIEDITLRAVNMLKSCEVLVCEDTRVTKDLLNRLEIPSTEKQFISFNDHSQQHNIDGIIELSKTKQLAFVSDAGSPLISDPAYPMIKSLVEQDIEFDCIGGVSAVNLALEFSGLAATPFHFHGFCGRDKAKLNKFSQTISSQYGTHVFFEGVSRVESTLKFFTTKFPDFNFVIGRELTKTFQSIHRFKGADFNPELITFKGEFVVLVHNNQEQKVQDEEMIILAQEIIDKGAKPKKLAKLLGHITGQNSKDIYTKML